MLTFNNPGSSVSRSQLMNPGISGTVSQSLSVSGSIYPANNPNAVSPGDAAQYSNTSNDPKNWTIKWTFPPSAGSGYVISVSTNESPADTKSYNISITN